MKQLYTLLFLTMPFMLQAQGTWSQRASLPADGRASGIRFTIDGIAYVGGGWSASSLDTYNDLWAYNPVNDTWTQKADLPVVRLNAISFAIGGKGYFGTGQSQGGAGYNNDFYEYDPANDTWTQRTSIPGGVRGGAFAFTMGNKAYVGGGINSTTGGGWPGLAMLQEYDPAIDQWIEKAMYPGSYRNNSASFTVNGMGYVAGGWSVGGGVFAQVYQYDPALDQWSQKTSLPNARGGATAFALNGNGYLIGGASVFPNPIYVADVLQYDPNLDTWTPLAPFPGGNRGGGMAFTLDGKGYHCAGRSASGAAVHNDLWEFAPLGTGVEEAMSSDKLVSYPNPSTGWIRIQMPLTSSGVVSCNLYDLMGKEVLSQTIGSTSVIDMDLSALSNGTYLLVTRSGDRIIQERVILQR
jgi:N-acetylneuraminic acid mutarotase